MINHIKFTKKKWGIKLLIWIYFQKILSRLGLKNNADFLREDDNYSTLLNLGFKIVKHQSSQYIVELHNRKNIFLRRFSSDYNVFKQIIIDDEYKELIKIIRERNLVVKNIIDAGANIGLASLVFQREFPNAKIYCVEPDLENSKILTANIKRNDINADVLKTGVWSKNSRLYFNRNFRDGKEWAISVSESPISDGFVDSVTIPEIMKENNIETVDVLKMDIEGAEFEIFCGEHSDLSFLENTKILAVEIHDEFGDKTDILNILKNYGFSISNSGEYTVAVK